MAALTKIVLDDTTRSALWEYILAHFTLDGTSLRLIDAFITLQYNNSTSDTEKLDNLFYVLNEIGLTRDEIVQIHTKEDNPSLKNTAYRRYRFGRICR